MVNKLHSHQVVRFDCSNIRFANSDSAIKFLKAYSEEIGFDSYKEVTVHPGRVVVIMTYLGLSPDKPSILLNSHTDVVPADYVSDVLDHLFVV